jgi:hypothetical protein
MKNLSLLFFSLILTLCAVAQNGASKQIPAVDKSPLDISYYPANFPILKIQDRSTEPLIARVIYSRPQKNGREVFGNLVEYNQIWRLGANEATEIEFYRDVTLGTTKIKKGRYTLYAFPKPESWTIIVNRDTDTWGSFKYDQAKDVARLDIKPEKMTDSIENFCIYFEKRTGGMSMIVQWDNVRAAVPFGF